MTNKEKIIDPLDKELSVQKSVEAELSFFQKQILKPIELSEKERKKVFKSRKTVQKFIDEILFNNKNNILNNNSTLELLLNYRPKIFQESLKVKTIINKKLIKDFGKNKKLAFLVLKNLIKSGIKLSEINFFINNISGENEEVKNILEEKFSKLLEQYGRISKQETQKSFYNIKDKKIIDSILNSKIIDEKGDINNKILKSFEKEFNENITENGEVDKNKILSFLLNKFGLTLENFKNNGLKIFLNGFTNLFKINKKIEKVKDSKSKENKKNNLSENVGGENDGKDENKNLNSETQSCLKKNSEFAEDYDFLNFCSPECSLYSHGSDYEIITKNNKLKISKEEFREFNMKSLENYLNFNIILYEAGLSFLLEDKYKKGFIQLLRNKILGFDFKKGQGFSEIHTLKALNIIGHFLGIPEKSYGKDGELAEFDGILGATETFKKINGTGIIKKEKVGDPGKMAGPNILEQELLNLKILGETGDFSVEKAEKILEKDGIIEEENKIENLEIDKIKTEEKEKSLDIINNKDYKNKKLA